MFENPTLHSGTYLYSLYMGVPPPPANKFYCLPVFQEFLMQLVFKFASRYFFFLLGRRGKRRRRIIRRLRRRKRRRRQRRQRRRRRRIRRRRRRLRRRRRQLRRSVIRFRYGGRFRPVRRVGRTWRFLYGRRWLTLRWVIGPIYCII